MSRGVGPRAVAVAATICLFVLAPVTPAFAPCHVGSFVGAPYKVSEGAGTVTIVYSNNSTSPQAVGSVDYRTVDATAAAGTDYTATSGTLSWGSLPAAVGSINPAYRTFGVPILEDAADESGETFTIEMSNFRGCLDAAQSDRSATVTITDDDPAPGGGVATTGTSPPPKTPLPPVTNPKTSTAERSSTPKATPAPGSLPNASATPVSAAQPSGSDAGPSRAALVGIVTAAGVAAGTALVLIRRRPRT